MLKEQTEEIGMIEKRSVTTMRISTVALAALVFCMAGNSTMAFAAEANDKLVARYTGMLNELRAELTAKVPKIDLEKAKTAGSPEAQQLKTFLASNKLDAKFAKYVVLLDGTPKGLAEFAQQGKTQAGLIKQLLADEELMLQMLVADGAKGGKVGPAMTIYTDIQKASKKSKDGVLQRLALATSLEHAVPIKMGRHSPADGPKVDPMKRYLQFEKAYLGGELDPLFEHMTTWELRYIVNWGAGHGGREQGRATGKPYMQVVRARSVGDVHGEKRSVGYKTGVTGIWNGIALRIQQEIIEAAKDSRSKRPTRKEEMSLR
jgi:hypothetical protein